jgi:hypothetical protein
MIIKRTVSPEKAIFALDVQMSKTTPKKDKLDTASESAIDEWVEIPVDLYSGVRETYGESPYLHLKHTEDSLKNEEQKASLITDLIVIFGSNPNIRPPLMY